ncbi:MAG: hypothetical protein S4CHLAM81_14920 [Chlamydiales bacterium]|nr:hypothetical protein [Chlamydiales bacterium]MCH9636261.1 hypothetical protein [Chlamydiales bacterium]
MHVLRKLNHALGRRGQSFAHKLGYHCSKSFDIRFPVNPYYSLSNNLLEQAREHFAQAISLNSDHLPVSSHRWATLMQECANNISNFQTVREAIMFAQDRMHFDHRMDAIHYFEIFPYYQALLEAEYPELISESLSLKESVFSSPSSLYRHLSSKKEGCISNVHFFHTHILLTCLKYVGSINNIVEIGGGYGNLCRLFNSAPALSIKNYCIVDLPQSLFFSELFLRANLPEVNVYYHTSDSIDLPDDKPNILLVPIQNAHNIKDMGISFELGINSGSLGELAAEWVDYWMNWIDQISCTAFYSLNYAGMSLTNWGEGANTMAPRFPKNWKYSLLRPAPPIVAMQVIKERYFCEIIAEKRADGSTLSEEELAIRYRHLQESIFTRQVYLYALDIARQTENSEILLDILIRCSNEFHYMPVESHWILQKIQHKKLPPGKKHIFDQLNTKIKTLYEQATHNVI